MKSEESGFQDHNVYTGLHSIACLNLHNFSLLVICVVFLFSSKNTSAQTISPKKGLSGDMLNNTDCITGDSLTWYYNWANTPNATVINTHQNYLEFCPMLWNGSWNPTALTNYLDAHPEVKYLLAFNEPNYNVQANMTPAAAAALWPQVEAIADAYNLKIVSPAMSYCSGTCIAGYDNMHGTVWLDDFFTACPGCRVDDIAVHIYDTWYHGFRGVLDLYKKYNRPIWVTEFDYSNATTGPQHAALMVDVIDLMEKDPDVFRYAWFLLRSSPATTSTDIYTQTSGALTDLGKVYMYMSSYDENYYHTVNTQIQAEHYISKSVIYCGWNGSICTWPYSIQLEPTTDASGRLHAFNFASPTAYTNDTLFYNVNIPSTGTYSFDFRVNSTAASTIRVRTAAGNTLLGTTGSLNTAGSWSTVNLAGVNMTAGMQRIYFTASNGTPLKLNWFRINCTSGCSLPVTLESFSASKTGITYAQLDWSAHEDGPTEYTVEKSNDGIHFATIGIPIESGGSSELKNYSFNDEAAIGAVLYYRLKIKDETGAISYSQKESVTMYQSQVSVYANVIRTNLQVPQEVSFSVVNIEGKIMLEGQYDAPEGTSEYLFALENLSEGIYFVKVFSKEIYYSGKVVR